VADRRAAARLESVVRAGSSWPGGSLIGIWDDCWDELRFNSGLTLRRKEQTFDEEHKQTMKHRDPRKVQLRDEVCRRSM